MIERLTKSVRETVSTALNELRQHPWLVLVLVFLGCSLLAPYFVINHSDGLQLGHVSMFFAFGLVLLGFVHRLPLLILCIPLALATLSHLHLSRHWGELQLNSRIEAAFESPPSEALEYLQVHIDLLDWLTITFLVLHLILLIYVVFINKQSLPGLQKSAVVMLAAWLVLVVALRMDQRLGKVPPVKLITKTLEAKDRYELLKGRRDFLVQQPLVRKNCASMYDKVVIVLGESAISDHMSLFGYEKPTTPFAVQSGPHAFDALAPSNQTRFSLAMMLTDASPGSFDVFYQDHSLVGELRACGFDTLWISNQGRVGMYDSFTTSLAMEANEQIFLNEWSWTETKYDEKIVEELAARDVYGRRRHATFIHLIGSHVRYDERYPQDFGASDVAGVVAQYDNSLLYTDHVLAELYKNFHDDSMLFIYVSDHGQYLSEAKFGSGNLPGFKEEFRIPLLIWTQDSAAIQQVRSAVGNSKLNVDSLNNVVHFLIGNTPSPGVSTSSEVSVLTPENVRDYNELKSFSAE